MSTHTITQRLQQVEAVMREHDYWQQSAPDAAAFNSDQPFCLDTMAPLEWLQWVLIPRMSALIASGAPMPAGFAVAPYYEVALTPVTPGYTALLIALRDLDALFAEPAR